MPPKPPEMKAFADEAVEEAGQEFPDLEDNYVEDVPQVSHINVVDSMGLPEGEAQSAGLRLLSEIFPGFPGMCVNEICLIIIRN